MSKPTRPDVQTQYNSPTGPDGWYAEQSTEDYMDEIDAYVAELEARIAILETSVSDHEDDSACLPEDQSVTETVMALRSRITELEGALRQTKDEMVDIAIFAVVDETESSNDTTLYERWNRGDELAHNIMFPKRDTALADIGEQTTQETTDE